MPPPDPKKPFAVKPDAHQGPQEARQGDPGARDEESTVKTPQNAQAAPQEPEVKFDETVPGGKYEVGGRLVDAHGKPLGKKKDEDAGDGE